MATTSRYGGLPRAVIAERFVRQLLAGAGAGGVAGVAERLLAVQAQDSRGLRLAVRARTSGLSTSHVDHAFTDERSIVVTWLCRGTLHAVCPADYWWLHALTAPTQRTGNARRLMQEGVDPGAAERGVSTIRRLTRHGPMPRDQLRSAVAAAGVPVQGQAFVHVLMLAELQGISVRGPVIDGQHAHVLVRDWLGRRPPLDRDAALTRLVRRYLAGHAPATDHDLARWSGLPLRDVRRGLAATADLVVGRDGLIGLGNRDDATDDWSASRLLGPFDPLLLGWGDRGFVLDEPDVVTTNGIFRPIALVDGRAAATWAYRAGQVQLSPFDVLDAEVRNALASEASDVVRFLST